MKDENLMTEDECAVRLLEPLRGEPAGPSRIDVPRAMREGHRRRWSRRWSAGVVVAAATALATGGGTLAVQALHPAPPPHPIPSPPVTALPVDCTVHVLPTGDTAGGGVSHGDPSGHFLAGSLDVKGGGFRAVLWQDGKLIEETVTQGRDSLMRDVNSAGMGVGYAFDAHDDVYAYVVEHGHVTRLPGGPALAMKINDAGVIAGSLGPMGKGVPARWASAAAAPTRLPLPRGATTGQSKGIDEDGTIVGVLRGNPSQYDSGYLWLPDGSHRAMPLPTVAGRKADYFWPASVSNGWVLGQAVFGTGDKQTLVAMRYHIGTDAYEKLPVNLESMEAAPNGLILGATKDGPLVLAGSRVMRLPKYGNLRDYVVSSFSADGRTAAGYALRPGVSYGTVPLQWTCH